MIDARGIVSQLKVDCRRGDLGTNSALLTAYPDRLKITYGNPNGLGGVVEIASESLNYTQHPEIASIHTALGWNIDEVHALISGWDMQISKMRIAPQETQAIN